MSVRAIIYWALVIGVFFIIPPLVFVVLGGAAYGFITGWIWDNRVSKQPRRLAR
jgi:uncharacterized membrane protein